MVESLIYWKLFRQHTDFIPSFYEKKMQMIEKHISHNGHQLIIYIFSFYSPQFVLREHYNYKWFYSKLSNNHRNLLLWDKYLSSRYVWFFIYY